MSLGVESWIISHIATNGTDCLIVGNDLRGALFGVRVESDYSANQLKGGLSSLLAKEEIAYQLTPARMREYRLTDKGRRRMEKLKELA